MKKPQPERLRFHCVSWIKVYKSRFAAIPSGSKTMLRSSSDEGSGVAVGEIVRLYTIPSLVPSFRFIPEGDVGEKVGLLGLPEYNLGPNSERSKSSSSIKAAKAPPHELL